VINCAEDIKEVQKVETKGRSLGGKSLVGSFRGQNQGL
jgi:hypothetical protein